MSLIYRLFLSLNSVSLFAAVYLIKEEIILNSLRDWFQCIYPIISYCVYLIIPFLLTFLSILLSKYLSHDQIDTNSIQLVEPANNQFLPTYLGYFFVALSIPNLTTFYIVFLMIFSFTYYSQASYFNPLFLFFRFNFFFLTNNKNIKVFLITKQNLKNPDNINLSRLKRINDYTFLDKTGE